MEFSSRNRDLTAIKYFLGFISLVIFVIILKELRTIFLPLCSALLLYFLVNGLSKILIKKNIPRIIALFILLVLISALIYFFVALIFSGVGSFVTRFPEYSEKISSIWSGIFTNIELPFKNLEEFMADLDWSKMFNQVTSFLSNTFESFAGFFGKFLLVIIFLIFMLGGRDSLMNRINKSFRPLRASNIIGMIDKIENHVQHYLVIKILVSLLTAFISWIILMIGGFNIVIFSIVLIFVLNFIPNFGSIVATTFPILLGLIDFGFSVRVILVASGLILTQFIIGNFLEPKITGVDLDISPIVILISLIFWGYVWGAVGMVLAVPLTSTIKLIFAEIEGLKPIASLISSK
jgi:predicted PurR-regulated permease PerM